MHKLMILFKWLELIAKFFYSFVFLARLNAQYPTANIETPNTIRFDHMDAIQFGINVSIGPYSEIVVYAPSSHSPIAGRLVIGDYVVIGKGANIRAAGGEIIIGEGSMLAQDVALIGANHLTNKDVFYREQPWDTTKVGVTIGKNVWVGAGVTVLPGVNIGDSSIIAAGAVVSKNVPSGEVWAGIPAVCIRVI